MDAETIQENLYHELMANECKNEFESYLEDLRHEAWLINKKLISELERE